MSCAPAADDVRVRVLAVLGAATLLGAALFLAFLSSFYLTFPWENTEPPEVWWLDPLFVSACASVVCGGSPLLRDPQPRDASLGLALNPDRRLDHVGVHPGWLG
jgi:hypothetical protein